MQRIQHGDDAIKQILLKLGIQEESICDVCTIIRVLRTKMVEEWDKNLDLYQDYITENLCAVSHTYLESGVYAGDAGDLMVANILHLPITVFTTVPNMPVICVMPTTTSVISTHPLFLAYTQGGPGHYDAVIMVEDTQEVDIGEKT